MNADAKECFGVAASLLQQATGCELSVAVEIVEMIARGVHWSEGTATVNGGSWVQCPNGSWEKHETASEQPK